MHKKGIAIILTCILSVMAAACGNLNDNKVDTAQTESTSEMTADENIGSQGQEDKNIEETDDRSDKPNEEQSKADINSESGEQAGEESLLAISNKVLELMKDKNFSEFSKYVHEEKGVRFTPYSSVDKKVDRCLSASEISGFSDDSEKHMWGYFDGSGFDMSLTNMEYWDQFVWNTDYTAAEDVNINKIVQTGNSIENLTEEYPDASFTEYHFSQLDPKNEGMDWCSLRLVFEDYKGEWKLVAIIHAQWTI